jgi:hypothetical protein
MKMKKLLVTLMGITLILMVSVVHATVLPGPGQDGLAYLHVGDPPNPVGTTNTYLYNGETVNISSTHLTILDVDGPTVLNPVWLILGVPNKSGGEFTAPSIALSQGTLVGVMSPLNNSLDPGEKLYQDMFSVQGDASQSFTNWSEWDLAVNGITATKFGIYVYQLTNENLKGKDTIDVTFNSPLDNGTFAVAMSWAEKKHKYATTPFTETGLTHQKVPEPGTFMLFGAGLVGAWFARRRFAK